MKWINILGLCLQFLAFWFAAPELLGVDALKRFEKGLIKLISNLPGMVFGFAGFSLGIILGVYGMKTGMEGNKDALIEALIIIGVVMVIYMVFMIFFYKPLQRKLEKAVATPLLIKLINNNHARKTALITGALFFTLGFLLQLTAVVFS
jgi:hypothetical protein